jgi:uncharacterized membrane protein (UPF0127 family)
MAVRNLTRNRSLGDRIALADGFFTRLRGLLGKPEPRIGEGLMIRPSGGVHMYGMKYSLDVLLLDASRRVVAVYPELKPGRRTRIHRNARVAIELPIGVIARSGTQSGDVIEWRREGVRPSDIWPDTADARGGNDANH